MSTVSFSMPVFRRLKHHHNLSAVSYFKTAVGQEAGAHTPEPTRVAFICTPDGLYCIHTHLTTESTYLFVVWWRARQRQALQRQALVQKASPASVSTVSVDRAFVFRTPLKGAKTRHTRCCCCWRGSGSTVGRGSTRRYPDQWAS